MIFMPQVSKKLNVLILGGSGFIGNAIIPEVISRGHKVFATYCNRQPLNERSPDLTWIGWDATTEPLPEIDWRRIDTVLHLANYSDLRRFPINAKPMFQIIVDSTFNLLDKAHASGIKRVVIASTGHVLPDIKIAYEEDATYAPKNFYGTIKSCAELLTTAYSNIMSAAVLRFFYPYGPGGERFLIGRLIKDVREGNEISIEGVDGIIINPVYLSDLARGTALALESMATGFFHLAGPDQITLRSFLELTGKLVGRRPVIKSVSKKAPGGHAGLYSRSKGILGYAPLISIETGLKNVLGLT